MSRLAEVLRLIHDTPNKRIAQIRIVCITPNNKVVAQPWHISTRQKRHKLTLDCFILTREDKSGTYRFEVQEGPPA